jgi:hypothetical protein
VPRGVPKSGKRKSRKQTEELFPLADRRKPGPKKKVTVDLTSDEKHAAAVELEGMFNTCAEHGQMPSDTIFKLVKWLGASG